MRDGERERLVRVGRAVAVDAVEERGDAREEGGDEGGACRD